MSESPRDPTDSRLLRWAVTGRTSRGDFASAIYGTILAASLLMAVPGGPLQIMASVIITAVVFWLAHVHVALMRGVARTGEHVTWPTARVALIEEWPLAQASISPAAPMLLAAIGLIGVDGARWIGIAICVVSLVAWGIVVSRRANLGRQATARTIAINVTLGLTLVVLKVIVH